MHVRSDRFAARTIRTVASRTTSALLTGVLAVTAAGFASGVGLEPAPPVASGAPTSVPTTGPATQPAVRIEATDLDKLKANFGKRAEVTGSVFRAQLSRSGKVFRIEFQGPKEGGMQAVVFERNLRAFRAVFGEDLGAALNGKKIAVVGILQDYQGKPEIILADIAQLKILP